MTFLLRIAERALNTPLLLTPEKSQIITSVLSGRIGLEPMVNPDHYQPNSHASRYVGTPAIGADGRDAGYRLHNGTAIVSVLGSLVNRGSRLNAPSSLVSYEGFNFTMRAAAAAGDVDRIVLDMQTPGGEAAGAFDAADLVRKVAAEKPVIAVVNDMAASAGYLLASATTRIITTQSGECGSIGVVLVHADMSAKLEAEGVKPTIIFAGDHKADGNPFMALPEAVRDRLQAKVDIMFNMFVDAVAQGRSGLTRDQIIETKADTFVGKEAVSVGLADDVGTIMDVLENTETYGG